MFFREQIEVLLPGRCAQESLEIARLSYFWNVPVINRVGTAPELFDNVFYPTLVQIPEVSSVAVAMAVNELMKQLKMSELLIVGPKSNNDKEHVTLAQGVRKYISVELPNLNVTGLVEIEESDWVNVFETVRQVRTPTKVIVIDGAFDDLQNVLTSIGVLELGAQSYLLILLCKGPSEACAGDVKDLVKAAKIVVLSSSVPKWKEGEKKLTAILKDAGYQADGKSFASNFKGQSFDGGLGKVSFDAGPALLQDYVFEYVPPDAENFVTAYNAKASATPCSHFTCMKITLQPGKPDFWTVEREQPIQPCFYSGGCTNYLAIGLSAAGVLSVVALSFFVLAYQRRRRLDVFRMHWRIPKQQLKIIENKKSKGKPAGAQGGDLSSNRRVITAYAIVGTAKAEFTSLKQCKKIRWDKEELKFIFELKRVNHDNLTTLLGICYNEGDMFYLCHNMIERASLEDFVNDQDFNMDNTFKSAFLRDTLKGVQYLHKSAIGFHGLLTLFNCLVDANWVLKLTNFGITNMLNKAIEREQLKLIEFVPLSMYFYIAPENMTDIAYGKTYPRGTAVGDIYSFGMMLYQIVFRVSPFDRANLAPKEILDEVKRKGLKPIVENTIPEEKALVDLMEECWQRNPELRPKLKKLNQVVGTAFESSKGNLVDQMIRMNEKYAQNLEQVVAERSSMLVEAQQQTDRLLCEMIPASIAEKLKLGQPIEPRSYDAATVLFAQLVDFSIFLTKSSPDQVIMFLNDVFTMFDHIIGQHDAYKVETTGETYMVASGVPNENGDRHVFEISEIALKFRESSYTYKVPNRPDWKLQVRIGYHCGPIAAGVIGIKAPRYCLFGDTVNFASRMQSNCPPNQIQMSEPTAMMLKVDNRYVLTKRGIVRVKGKGDVNTYWLNEHCHNEDEQQGAAVGTPQPGGEKAIPNGRLPSLSDEARASAAPTPPLQQL
ncbi:Protein GCY-27 a [Aphelenchoides avenae]|nr:Protein GCY-27 a [Aphelenchus avenae]